MNVKDCIEMGANLKYIKEVSGIRYGLNANDIISSKAKDEVQAKNQAEIVLD